MKKMKPCSLVLFGICHFHYNTFVLIFQKVMHQASHELAIVLTTAFTELRNGACPDLCAFEYSQAYEQISEYSNPNSMVSRLVLPLKHNSIQN